MEKTATGFEMSAPQFEWFKCYHGDLLKELITLQHEQASVYMIIYLSSIDRRGSCPDSIEALARWTGLNRKKVMAARHALLKAGKIIEVEGGLTTREAQLILDAQKAAQLRGGPGIGKNSKAKTERNQQLGLLREEDKKDNVSLTGDVARAKVPKYPKPKLIALPADWTPKPTATSFAAQFGLTAADVDLIAVKMTAHALANGILKENWDAYLRKWIVKEWEIRAREKALAEKRMNGNRGPSLADIAMGH